MNHQKNPRRGRLVRLAAPAVLILAVSFLAACENSLLGKAQGLRSLAESPIIGLVLPDGAQLAQDGILTFPDTSSPGGACDISITVANTGKTPLALDAAATTVAMAAGTEAGSFSVASVPPAIPAGQTGLLVLRFSPRSVDDKAAVVTVACNDLKTPKLSFTVKGKGLSDAKDITAFSIPSLAVNGVITDNNIVVAVPAATDVTKLVASFATTGVSVKVNGNPQISGNTVNDFSEPLNYLVTAADGTTKTYQVAVDRGATMTAFALSDPPIPDTINQAAGTIRVIIPLAESRAGRIAYFSAIGARVWVGWPGVRQISGETVNDFTSPVTYNVRSPGGQAKDYVVTVVNQDPTPPVLSTAGLVTGSRSSTTASLGGNITDYGGAAVTARGVCWSTGHNPTTADQKTGDGSGTGSFVSNLSGLAHGTTYYVRAWATNAVGTGYGQEVAFTTKQVITFHPNDAGAGGTMAPQEADQNTTVALSANAFAKTGYSFAGWALTPAGGMAYGDGVNVAVATADINLYAKWTPNPYKVTFNGNGADSGDMARQTIVYDSPANLSANLYGRSGYAFKGWAKSANSGVVDLADKAVYGIGPSDITLYAVWQGTLSFDGNGATGGSTAAQSPNCHTAAALPANGFSRDGYAFMGWATSATGTVAYADQASFAFSTNTTLYAVWRGTLSFDGNGATGGSTATQAPNCHTTAKLPANGFSRAGYAFVGWATGPASAAVYGDQADYTFTTNTTLYAVWQGTISFDGNGADPGSPMASRSYSCNATVSLPANGFSRAGYAFAGWATSPGGAVAYADQASYTFAGNATLYAVWRGTLGFDGNGATGGSMAPQGVNCNTTASLPSVGYTKPGYTFMGWATSPGGSVAYGDQASYPFTTNTTLYAVWASVITFDGNGSTGGSTSGQAIRSGALAALNANGYTKPGYTFMGWATSSGGTVAYQDGSSLTPGGNATLYAVWLSPPTNLATTIAAAGQVVASWTAGAAANGSTLSYNLYYSTASGQGLGGTKVGGAANPSTVGGLTNWTKYYFTLSAVNGSGEVVAIADVSGTPVNQILQLSNANSDKIEGWTVNSYTGAASQSKLNSVGAGPAVMVADNNLLYCTNVAAPTGTHVFTIDGVGGLGNYQLFVENGQVTEGLVMAKPAPGKRFLYFSFPNAGVGATNIVGYELDPTTGKMGASRVAAVTIGSGYGYVRQLAVNPAGTLLFVSCMQNPTYILVYSINTATGALTLVGPIASAALNRPFKMQVDPSGKFLYVAHYGAGNLVAIKLADMSLIGVYATGVNTNCVAIDPSGKYLYAGSGAGTGANGVVSAYAINAATGALTSIGSYDSGGWYPAALSVDLSGSFLAVSNSQNNKLSIFNINPASGALTWKVTKENAGNGAGEMLFVRLP